MFGRPVALLGDNPHANLYLSGFRPGWCDRKSISSSPGASFFFLRPNKGGEIFLFEASGENICFLVIRSRGSERLAAHRGGDEKKVGRTGRGLVSSRFPHRGGIARGGDQREDYPPAGQQDAPTRQQQEAVASRDEQSMVALEWGERERHPSLSEALSSDQTLSIVCRICGHPASGQLLVTSVILRWAPVEYKLVPALHSLLV